MRERPKNIGQLFKDSLDDLEVNDPVMDWPVMEMKVEKLKFFKFGITYFNVYYASLIALTFLFSSGILVDHFFIHKSEEQIITTDTTLSSDSLVQPNEQDNDFSGSAIQRTKKGKYYGKNDKDTLPEKINSDSVLSTGSVVKDSIITPPVPVENKEVKKKTPQKKIIYITKQDTVIVMDTVKTKNKKKLR